MRRYAACLSFRDSNCSHPAMNSIRPARQHRSPNATRNAANARHLLHEGPEAPSHRVIQTPSTESSSQGTHLETRTDAAHHRPNSSSPQRRSCKHGNATVYAHSTLTGLFHSIPSLSLHFPSFLRRTVLPMHNRAPSRKYVKDGGSSASSEPYHPTQQWEKRIITPSPVL